MLAMYHKSLTTESKCSPQSETVYHLAELPDKPSIPPYKGVKMENELSALVPYSVLKATVK